ncbi:MAG: ATP-binding protein [Acidobacteria bacterium]|nr:ATP-binding protein [Acidobacteriota bacterium]
MVIVRQFHLDDVIRLLRTYPVVAILGARQVGKTTLAAMVAHARQHPVTAFDLENPADVSRLSDPMLALETKRGLVILDEVQHRPDLFPILRVLADRSPMPARFLVLGSASAALLRQTSESLAGRISVHHLEGFSLAETGVSHLRRLWLRGGFPRSYLARSDAASDEWRRNFIRTFVERDLPQLGVQIPSATLGRFWSMLAHYHGQTWNGAELARAFGVSDMTVRRYLDLLAATFVVRVLPPWHENLAKRQVKSPKVYISDSGVLHTLLGIQTHDDLERHPKVGASWEGFGLGNVVDRLRAGWHECFYWRTHAGAELDLLVVRGRVRRGFEFKRTTAPSVTPSMRQALIDLKLSSLDVIHAGSETFPMAHGIRAVALSRLHEDVRPLG